jgi:predicted enzyme related to lactoylglutathione lyase
MPNHVRVFSIMTDDTPRARKFYEAVFGWTFEPWGPPGFYLIRGAGLEGSMHQRQEPLTGTGYRAFEITVGVESIDAIEKKIVPAGGTITMPKMRIETVGTLLYLNDTEGNRVGVMQYDAAYEAARQA